MLRESRAVSADFEGDDSAAEISDEWDGFPDKPNLDIVDHEEEYVDEDRYTTVKIESVSVSKDGLCRPDPSDDEAEEQAQKNREEAERKAAEAKDKKPSWPKKKKKKFRYETTLERQLADNKQRIKSQRP